MPLWFLNILLAAFAVADPKWPSVSFKTEPFAVPKFEVQTYGNASTDSGYLFLGMVHPDNSKCLGPFIANDAGDIVWHGPQDYAGYYNFQTQQVGGVQRLTWWDGYLQSTGHGYGQVRVMDETYNIVQTICLPDSIQSTIVVPNPALYPGNLSSPCYVDKHESMATNRNSIIVTAYNITQANLTQVGGPENGYVYECMFFELSLDTNDILFQWKSLTDVPVTKSHFLNNSADNPLDLGNSVEGGSISRPWDYFHINSVQYVPGGYIISSRMTWSIYFINSTTGSVQWTLEGNTGGDFTLDEPIFFSWQHDPRLQKLSKNGNEMLISFFNNDNIDGLAFGQNVSTGYFLKVNTNTMKVSTLYDLHAQPDGPIYTGAEGSVQQLQYGHKLIGYGDQAFIEEYDNTGNLIYIAQFAYQNDSTHSYRTYRLPWSGYPTTVPAVVASEIKHKHTEINVYMSWNGATELANWNLYAGPSQQQMKLVTNTPRKSFETMITFPKGKHAYRYVMAEALDANNTSLANSTATMISGVS